MNKLVFSLILIILVSCNARTQTSPVVKEPASQPAVQPTSPIDPNIRINFKDLTIGQIEQLNGFIARTSYKDSLTVKPDTQITPQQADRMLKALTELPYKDVAVMIDLIYTSGVKQVKAQAPQRQ